jgi:hypothetical protein
VFYYLIPSLFSMCNRIGILGGSVLLKLPQVL